MPVRVASSGCIGISAYQIDVEVDVSPRAVGYITVGLPDVAVRESRQRVQTAIKNCGFHFPNQKIVVNLTPANLRKEGTLFDLPIALGIIQATRKRTLLQLEDTWVVGELSLTGSVQPVRGVLAIAIGARDHGIKRLVVPRANAAEAVAVLGERVCPVGNLNEAVDVLQGNCRPLLLESSQRLEPPASFERVDLDFIRGQSGAKRALEIAAAGGHNVMFTGPPGTGKTLLARALMSILPPLSKAEKIEVSQLYSVAGLLMGQGLVAERPFRAPHSTATTAALVGGGRGIPRPGEVSLAHHGVLFLDEFPEFSRPSREALREPLESGQVQIARAHGAVCYPSDFQLIATMNPCPCGYHGFSTPARVCRCTEAQVATYQARLSGPMRDRFDLEVSCPPVPRQLVLGESRGESSDQVAKRVATARSLQRKRLAGTTYHCNAQVQGRRLEALCRLDRPSRILVSEAMDAGVLSVRAFHRAARVARTIADLDGAGEVAKKHIAEALRFRSAGQCGRG